MTKITRRDFGMSSLSFAAALAGAELVPTSAFAADSVRHGIQIGALGALRTTLPTVEQKYDLKYDVKDFRESTAALLALEQGELDIANTTSQHLVRAMSEGIDVVWIAGWGGGYNVLVASKSFDVTPDDDAALKAALLARKQSGKPVSHRRPDRFFAARQACDLFEIDRHRSGSAMSRSRIFRSQITRAPSRPRRSTWP